MTTDEILMEEIYNLKFICIRLKEQSNAKRSESTAS